MKNRREKHPFYRKRLISPRSLPTGNLDRLCLALFPDAKAYGVGGSR